MEENKGNEFTDLNDEIEQVNSEVEAIEEEKELDEEVAPKKRTKKGKHSNVLFKIFFGFIGVLLLVFTFFYVLSPSLKLKGDEKLVLEFSTDFKEPGYEAKYFGKDISDKVYTSTDMDFSKIGDYVIKYMVRKNRIVVTRERKVSIVDTKKPEITLTGEDTVKICPNKEYIEEGYTAKDNYDGDLTSKVKVTNKDDKVNYTVKDSSGNIEKKSRTIVKEDLESPVITLKGNKNTYVIVGNKYEEPGFTATDNCDEDITSKVTVSGTPDTSKAGNYEITYTVKDSSGNEAKEVRKVIVSVKAASSSANLSCGEPGVIYLTLDDGPGPLTPQFLDIFDKYNVKVTFFVTNQFPKYNYLIGEEHKRGHKVALHTYTHDSRWSFYYGVDKYFDDFDKMNAVIEKQTGKKTTLFRFPGGSSNTVSCNRGGRGIMTNIVNEATARGYTYFDWNISSGDAGGTTNPDQVYKNVINGLRKDRGNVVLMHDIHNHTLKAIERIVKYGVENGYTFKTLDSSIVCKQKLAC